MNLRDLVLKTRSYRRFEEQTPILIETLTELVDTARLTGSAGNKQPLRYLISTDPKMNERIFPTLAWAGALPDWPGPEEGERPTAYVVIAGDRNSWWEWSMVDLGVVAQTMLLGAAVHGLGGCMIGSFKRKELAEVLDLPESLELRLVLALGKPVEEVVLEEVTPGTSLAYYRTPDRVHHVPKLRLEDVIHKRW
ncbi:MAG: nitroreductase [Spirochaetaceae bacterium]|nr:MAG: nitroreductase [Spirochaetaceae bacterium]